MNKAAATKKVDVTRVAGDKREAATDVLAGEEPMEIRLTIPQEDGLFTRSLSVTMRTPGDDFELAAGFLFTEGIVSGAKDIERIEYTSEGKQDQEGNVVTVALRPGVQLDVKRLLRNFYVTSSCGVCGKTSLDAVRVVVPHSLKAGIPKISPKIVRTLPDRLRESQSLFAQTGGLHAAGLFTSEGRLDAVAEDVGRHNAVDKVVGRMLMQERLPLSRHLLFVSGRTSYEIVQKAFIAGIPIVGSVSAPSTLAIDLAREAGVTLVGFVRGDGFNIYTHPGRVGTDR